MLDLWSIMIIIMLGVVAIFVAYFFFVLSLRKTLKLIPQEYHRFPKWLYWFLLIPVIQVVFMWILLPFGLPHAIKTAYPNNSEAQSKASTLFGVGLAYAILTLAAGLFDLFGVAAFGLWIIYWVHVVKVRKYLINL